MDGVWGNAVSGGLLIVRAGYDGFYGMDFMGVVDVRAGCEFSYSRGESKEGAVEVAA